MENTLEWTVLSKKKEELRHMIGYEIVNILKISYDGFQDYLNYLDEIYENRYRDRFSYFRFHYGRLIFFLNNGIKYSFSIADDLNSLIMSCEEGVDERFTMSHYLNDDTNVKNISIYEFMDEKSVGEFLNQPIVSISILTMESLSGKLQYVPSEMGLEIMLQNKKKILLHHNLTIDSFFFINFDENSLISNTKVKFEF